jgi:hypothetical protein
MVTFIKYAALKKLSHIEMLTAFYPSFSTSIMPLNMKYSSSLTGVSCIPAQKLSMQGIFSTLPPRRGMAENKMIYEAIHGRGDLLNVGNSDRLRQRACPTSALLKNTRMTRTFLVLGTKATTSAPTSVYGYRGSRDLLSDWLYTQGGNKGHNKKVSMVGCCTS